MSLFGTVERFGGGDDSWLGSRHAVENAESGTLNADAFDVEDDVVPSGTPVAVDGDLLVPFTGAVSGEGDDAVAQVLRGFVIGDHSIAEGDKSVPVLWHGRVIVENLPVDITVPAGPTAFTFA